MADFDERLVESVRKRPAIYDLKRPDFKDFKKKEVMWLDIASELSTTEGEVKKRWKTIRDRYTREKKNASLPTGSESFVTQKWPLFSALSFLSDHIKHKSTISNYHDDEESNNSEKSDNDTVGGFLIPFDLEVSNTSQVEGQSSRSHSDYISSDDGRSNTPVENKPPSSKRKAKEDIELEILKNIAGRKKTPLAEVKKPQSSVELYCLSLVSRIEAMEPKKQAMARKKIEDVLYELEFGVDVE